MNNNCTVNGGGLASSTSSTSSSFIFNDVDNSQSTLDDIVNTTPLLSLVNSTNNLNPPVAPSSSSTPPSPSSFPSYETSNNIISSESTSPSSLSPPNEEIKEEEDQDEEEKVIKEIQNEPISSTNVIQDNPFQIDNRKSRELYTTKILEKQKSLDNLPLFYSDKILNDKRHLFIKKLVNRVFSTLKSSTSEDLLTSQRNKILKELFRNISSELDDTVLEHLNCDEFKQPSPKGTPIKDFTIFSPKDNNNCNQQQIPPLVLLNEISNSPIQIHDPPIKENKPYAYTYPMLDDKDQPIIYYYQLISYYLLHMPSEVDKYRPLLLSLYNNHWFFLIFSSLFYLWLLEYRLSLIPQVNVFIKATNRLFWHDKDHNSIRFKEIYMTIKKKLLDSSLWYGLNEADRENQDNGILIRNRRIWIDFYHIISVFYFYYEDQDNFQLNLNQFRNQINYQFNLFINEKSKREIENETQEEEKISNDLSIDDIFVRGIIRHLYQIKHEDILIKYIDNSILFKDWNLNKVTKIKLQTCLYSFSKPGSPAHMPRDVRVASRKALDILFPEGRLSRHTVNLFFRLLHPYYSTGSIVHWLTETLKYYTPSFLKSKNNQNNQN